MQSTEYKRIGRNGGFHFNVMSIDRVPFRTVQRIAKEIQYNKKRKIGKSKTRVEINGLKVKLFSLRLRTFIKHGSSCYICGKHAPYFRFTKNQNEDGDWYLTLIVPPNKKGETETIMTADHVIPKSKGGSNSVVDNLRPCCFKCNQEKGDKCL